MIHVLNQYSELVGNVGGASVELKSLADEIMFGLSRVCIEESLEILLLLANEYPSGASKLLRGLYERTVTLLYLEEHPEKAERFQHYAAIQEHRVVAAARKLFSDEQIDAAWKIATVRQVEQNYQNFKGEFQKTKCKKCQTREIAHSWDVDLASMADRVGGGMPELYLPSYSLPTLHAHATFASAYSKMTASEHRIVFDYRPSDIEIDLCNAQVFTLMHRVFKATVTTFDLTFEEQVEEFGTAIQKFWGDRE